MKPIVASHYQQVVEEIETVTLSRDGPHHWEDSNGDLPVHGIDIHSRTYNSL
jgi:hypothetical protein